jgi:hypothetical protein
LLGYKSLQLSRVPIQPGPLSPYALREHEAKTLVVKGFEAVHTRVTRKQKPKLKKTLYYKYCCIV